MDKFEKFTKIDESNIDIILEDIKEFLHLYLFKGNVSLNSDEIHNLFELSYDDLTTLKVVHFMLSDEVKNLIKILPHLVRNLSHTTQNERKITQGHIRGKVDWGSTIKKRYSKGFNDKSLFVCTPSSKLYDLEENQLLKFLLKKIRFLKHNYLDFVKPDSFDISKIDLNEDWYTIVNDNSQMAKLSLKKVYFNEISDVKIKSKHIRKCIKNRNVLYHQVAKTYMLYEGIK